MSFRIGIIGLGLMGASLASALKGFRGAEIVGTDTDAAVCAKAVAAGVVTQAYATAPQAVAGADLVVLCVYAHHIPALMAQCREYFKAGAVVSDICGVKSELYAALLPQLPPQIDYVGIHPMAGKERDGFDNADPAIYRGSGFIVCPLPGTQPGSIALVQELALHIGVNSARMAVAPYDKHDAIIAYTSDLMHIAATALCMDYHPDMSSAFTAGAFRDCTRIADINAPAWTELLMSNRDHVGAALDSYIAALVYIRQALAQQDSAGLCALLARGGENKRGMLQK